MSIKKKKQTNYINDTKKDLNFILTNLYFKTKNENQKLFCDLIDEKEIIICSGPAGVGKSMLSIAKALELVKNPNNEFSKIILCTPAVEAEESLGSLPGDVLSKLDPYIYSSLYLVKKLIGEIGLKQMMEGGFIEIMAFAYMRGINIDNAIVIAEEIQNATPRQVKTLLTRIGKDSKFIISGDLDQSDRYKKQTDSGLYDAFKRLCDIDEIGLFKFNETDIVRNKVISKILDKYKD